MNTAVKNIVLAPFNALYTISPRACLKLLFRIRQGYALNLDDPQTFSEKIQWIKLYDKNPLMPRCADKYTVRDYVEKKGFSNLLNSLLWQGHNPEEIPFDDLPSRYVIKATHGSTFNMIVKDASTVDRKTIISTCKKWLKTDFLPCYGEWFYGRSGGIKPRIIIEEFLDSGSPYGLDDYKVFVINGKVEMVLVCSERTSESHLEDFYDKDWNVINGIDMGEKKSGKVFSRPACLTQMLRAAEVLAAPFNLARVDFYIVNNSPIFGEITFTSGSGFDRFHPYEFDLELGHKLTLPC